MERLFLIIIGTASDHLTLNLEPGKLSKITAPTLITQGVHDRVVPYTNATLLNRGIRGSKLVPFEFSGHALFWEERDKFNQLLMEFIG